MFIYVEHQIIYINASRLLVIRHIVRLAESPACRFLLAGDNLATVFCSAKGRSSAYAMLSRLRACCAYIIAGDLQIYDRWLTSERNKLLSVRTVAPYTHECQNGRTVIFLVSEGSHRILMSVKTVASSYF